MAFVMLHLAKNTFESLSFTAAGLEQDFEPWLQASRGQTSPFAVIK